MAARVVFRSARRGVLRSHPSPSCASSINVQSITSPASSSGPSVWRNPSSCFSSGSSAGGDGPDAAPPGIGGGFFGDLASKALEVQQKKVQNAEMLHQEYDSSFSEFDDEDEGDDDDDEEQNPFEDEDAPDFSYIDPDDDDEPDIVTPEYLNFNNYSKEKQSPPPPCPGGRQRKGHLPNACDHIDLDDLHYTNLPLLQLYTNESGMIKPRNQTGMCTRCQRKFAKTVKQARKLAMIPHIQEFTFKDTTPYLEDFNRGGRTIRILKKGQLTGTTEKS